MSDRIIQDLVPFLKFTIAPYAFLEIAVFCFMVVLSAVLFLYRRQLLVCSKKRKVETPGTLVGNFGVSVVIPAYNEAATIVDSLETVLAQNHADFEVIVVNDASKDETLAILTERFALFEKAMVAEERLSSTEVLATYMSATQPNLVVVDKAYSGKGKGDALNVGMSFGNRQLLCVLDADSLLHPDSLAKLAMPFSEDNQVIAAGGAIRAGNGRSVAEILSGKPPKIWNPLVFGQMMEYARIFFVDRLNFSCLNCNVIISGAFGMFDRQAMFAVGGYQCDNLAEDMALTMRLHRHFLERKSPYRIVHVPEAQCWTEVPFNLRLLYRQRTRWHAGYVQSAIENVDLLFKPAFGVYANFALPYCLSLALEPLFLVASLTLFYNFFASNGLSSGVIGGYFAVHSLLSMTYIIAFIVSNEFHRKLGFRSWAVPFWAFPVWLVFGRVYDTVNMTLRLAGLVKYLRKERTWGEMDRVGFQKTMPKSRSVQVASVGR